MSVSHSASSSSLYGALTPSPPKTKRDRHVAPGEMEEGVIAREQQSHQRHMQRDDFPSSGDNDVSGIRSSAVVDRPRVGHSTLLGTSGPGRHIHPNIDESEYSPPSHTPSDAVYAPEDTQSNSLCAQLHEFHFGSPTRNEGCSHHEQCQTGFPQYPSSPQAAASIGTSTCRATSYSYSVNYAKSRFQVSGNVGLQATSDPSFIPAHEHAMFSDQTLGDVSAEGFIQASTDSAFGSNLGYRTGDPGEYSNDQGGLSYASSSFPGGYACDAPPKRDSLGSARPVYQHTRRSMGTNFDAYAMTYESDCGYDLSSRMGATAVSESDAVQNACTRIPKASRHASDRDHLGRHSQSTSFLQYQHHSQLPRPSRQLSYRISSDHFSALSLHTPDSSSSQPSRGDDPIVTHFRHVAPVSATGHSGVATCSTKAHPQPASAHAVLHEMLPMPLRNDPRLAVQQGNTASHSLAFGGSPQPSGSFGSTKIEYDEESSTPDPSEMKEEESHSALPQLAMSSTHIALPLTPYDSDRFSHSQGASTPPSLQSPSSSPAMQSSPRQLRRWSSVNVSSTPLRSLAVHQTGSQLNPTRLRRHSQADTIIPSQGPARRVSSRSRSPTPGMGQSSMQANQVLQPIADTPTQAHGMTSASSSNTAMSSNSNLPDRQVVVCDGYLVDEESVQNALRKPDKLLHLYECLWDRENTPCRMWVEGDQASIADHLQHFHGFKGGETTTRCLWQDCPKRNMKGTSIARHVVTHVGFRIKCDTCKHEFARGDACNRAHSRSGCTGVGQPMYGELQLVLDARKADFGYRHMKKRRLEDP